MLGVKRSSLYSYVSRGLLRAQKLPGQKGSSYLLADVMRLTRQRAAIRNPAKVAQSALDWGQAVLPSAITQVREGQFFYRGHNAVALAEHATLEDIAALLWQCDLNAPREPVPAPALPRTGALPSPAEALRLWHQLPQATAVEDQPPLALLHAMCAALLGLANMQDASAMAIHRTLQRHWNLDDRGGDLLRRALVLCADHELNASTFAVRVVASTGATLHSALGAGLAALSGPKHGGMTQLIDSHWDDWHAHSNATPTSLAPHLQSLLHETHTGSTPNYCAGFGHPLYPEGDPRSIALLSAISPTPEVQRLTAAVLAQTGLHPSLDYALVALQRSLGLPRGAAFVLFALGRTVGWMAHAAEQVAGGQLIRPRAIQVDAAPEVQAKSTKPAKTTSSRVIRFL